MKYQYLFLIASIWIQPLIGSQHPIPEMFLKQLIEEAQKDWSPKTKTILNDPFANVKTADIFERYTKLFILKAKERYQPQKSAQEIGIEVSELYPTRTELNTILYGSAGYITWIKSWVSNPLCANEWKQKLPLLEANLANEEYESRNPYQYLDKRDW